MPSVAFISSVFSDVPIHYQGSRLAEEPLDLLYAIAATRPFADARLTDLDDEAGRRYLADADVVVFSTTNSYLQWNNHPLGIDLLRSAWHRAREVAPQARTVVFGPHVPDHATEIYALGADLVLLGEAELAVAAAVAALLGRPDASPAGLVPRSGDQPAPAIVTELDDLPRPAWEETVGREYAAHNHPSGGGLGHLYETSRGCPFACTYCNTVTHRRAFRTKSPDKIAADLTALAGMTRRDYVYFIDESFAFRGEWLASVTDVLRDLPFRYGCQGNLRFITPEKLDAMSAAGFISMEFGFETADEKIMRSAGKDNRMADVPRNLRHALDVGIAPLLFILVGLPGETRESLERTCDFLASLPAAVRVSIALPTPYRGTRFYAQGQAAGVIPAEARGLALYDFSGRIGHRLHVDAAAAAAFRDRYGPNNTLGSGFVERLRQDLRDVFTEAVPDGGPLTVTERG